MMTRTLFALMLSVFMLGSLASAIGDAGDDLDLDRMNGVAICLNCGLASSASVGFLDYLDVHGAKGQHGRGSICIAIVCTAALLTTSSGPLLAARSSQITPRVEDQRLDVYHSPPFRPPRQLA